MLFFSCVQEIQCLTYNTTHALIVPVDVQMQRNQHYNVFMLEHDYVGAFALGFSLNDPWIRDFKTSHTPAVLFDNYIIGNPTTAYVRYR